MEGDKFEMEDHRNWMDASYKTYVCSLLESWPYMLKNGKPFTQSMTVTYRRQSPRRRRPAKRAGGDRPWRSGGTRGQIPANRRGRAHGGGHRCTGKLRTSSRRRKPRHWLSDRWPESGQREAAANFRELSPATGVPYLETVLPAKKPARKRWRRSRGELCVGGTKGLRHRGHPGARPQVVSAQYAAALGPSYEEMAAAARRSLPGCCARAAACCRFHRIEPQARPKAVFDFITHTGCPMRPCRRRYSVMETLETASLDICVDPGMIGKDALSLGPPPFRPATILMARWSSANPDKARVCLADIDPRQRGLFAAAWKWACRGSCQGLA